MKLHISKICNCRICIDVFFPHIYPHLTARVLSLIRFIIFFRRTTNRMWFTQDASNCLDRFKTRWFENLPGGVYELVTTGSWKYWMPTGYLDHVCCVYKYSYFLNSIFLNLITVNNMFQLEYIRIPIGWGEHFPGSSN